MRVYSRSVDGHEVWYAEGYYFDDGRRIRWRRSTGVPNDGTRKGKQSAEAIAGDIQKSLATGQGREGRPTTLAQAISKLIVEMERAERSQSTIDIVNEKAVRLWDHFDPHTRASSITKQHLAEYTDQARKPRVVDDQEIPGRHNGTIHRELRTLRQALRAAGIVPPDMPNLGTVYKPRERHLDHAQTLRLLTALNPKWRDHFVMYRQLGLSKSELYQITADDIDWKRHEVHVRGTKTETRDRVLPLSAEIEALLEARKGRDPMFETWTNANRDLNATSIKAQLGPLSFNDLRRSFATDLAAAGVPMLHLMHLMGHSSTRMLEKVYARVERGQHMHTAVAALKPLKTTAHIRHTEKQA